jgi:hypothetical protein
MFQLYTSFKIERGGKIIMKHFKEASCGLTENKFQRRPSYETSRLFTETFKLENMRMTNIEHEKSRNNSCRAVVI